MIKALEARGVRRWIAPRNVRPGRPFDDEIADAIEGSQAMLLIFSSRCNDSEYIRREVTVAGESQKVVIPFRIENAAAEPRSARAALRSALAGRVCIAANGNRRTGQHVSANNAGR